MDDVFKALAGASRRKLLDRLFKRDGQTLGELCERVDMTRFGVMKHLRVLEEAGLLVTEKRGREKLHYLNPMPIRLVHDRWVSKYRAPFAASLSDLKSRLEDPMAETQVYELFIPQLSNEISTVTYLIEKRGELCKLSVRHDLADAPKTAGQVNSDGWQWILSNLKTLLETGQPLPAQN